MFDTYVSAKNVKRAGWVIPILVATASIHAAAGTGLVVYQFWTIEELDRPDPGMLSFLSAPPPPPPPPAGSKSKVEKKDRVKKTKDLTQVDERKEKPKVEDDSDDNSEDGVEGGVEGGVVGGVVGGVLGGVEGGVLGGMGDAPPPPPPDKPQIVPQVALEAQRISGEKQIQPPNDVSIAISRTGKKATGVLKMCLNSGGKVASLKVIKSTGYPKYDAKLQSKMRQWKYRPFKVNGKAVPVCTSVTFIFNPK